MHFSSGGLKNRIWGMVIALSICIMMGLGYISSAEAKKPKQLKIVAASDWRPYSYVDGKGRLKGVLIDYWNSWGDVSDVEVVFDVKDSWTAGLDALKKGEGDAFVGLFYNDERSEHMDFSSPIIELMTGIYVRDSVDAFDIKDLKDIGVGVSKNNYARVYMEKTYPEVNLYIYEDLDSVMKAADSGVIDAVCIDYHNNFREISFYYPELKNFNLLQTLYTQPLRAGVKKGETELLEFINEGMDRMSPSQKSDIYSNWEYVAIYFTKDKLQKTVMGISVAVILVLLVNTLFLRKRIEAGVKRLADSEESYKKLVQLCPDGIFVQRNGEIAYVNNAALDIIGHTSYRSIEGMRISNFIRPTSRDSVESKIKSIRELDSAVLTIEEKLLKESGNLVDVEMSVIPMTYKGSPSELIMIRDVSQRNEREKEKQRVLREKLRYERLKTEFFANISHELRTPLNILLGAVQLMDRDFSKNRKEWSQCKYYSRYSKLLTQNCYRLIRLVNNLIDTTKIDLGFLNMNFKNRNIVQVVEDITMSVVGYIKEKGINIIFDTDVEEKIISCDADNIERVMLNLLSNSIKFTSSGGSIFVNVYDRGESVHVSVRDTGIGIPQEEQPHIFERFRQVHPLLNRNREGSGIGLSLVKSIVEAHNGNISLKSKQGEGSEFIIEMPAVESAEGDISFGEGVSNMQEKIEKINIEFSDIYSQEE